MDIDLTKLNYSFQKKPLLVGGKAMEFYGLRKSGNDIDFIAAEEDVVALINLYPNRVKNLWGDLGVCPFEFEIWRTICLFDHTFYSQNAIEKESYFIISKEKLLLMKAFAMKKEKYLKDLELIVNNLLTEQYKHYPIEEKINASLLSNIPNITYIEKSGPES